MRVLLAVLLSCVVLSPSVRAGEVPSASALLQLAGTAAVFDSPSVQRALASPAAAPDAQAQLEQLLSEAGLRRWLPPRVWLLRARSQPPGQWENLAPALAAGAQSRGFTLVGLAPLPSAESAMAYLVPERENPGLAGLLAAYDADVLVLLRDRQWTLWAPGLVRRGVLPGTGIDVLPGVLAEVLAAQQQWPEARGQSMIEVDNVARMADFAAVQSALLALPGVQSLRLVRLEHDRAVFALAAPAGRDLLAALDAEPRLPGVTPGDGGLGPLVASARLLGCPLLRRHWKPAPPAAAAGRPAEFPE